MRPRKPIVPSQNRARPGYIAVFRHPVFEKKIARVGLNTQDVAIANGICAQLTRLRDACVADKAITTAETAIRKGFDAAISRIFFGGGAEPTREWLNDAPPWLKSILHTENVAALPDLREQLLDGLETEGATISLIDQIMETDVRHMINKDQLVAIIAATAELRRINELEDENKQLRAKADRIAYLEQIEGQYKLLQQQLNKHVKVRIGKAIEDYMSRYLLRDRAKTTVVSVRSALESFAASLKNKHQHQLADVTGADIDSWLQGLKKRDGQRVTFERRKGRRAYLSTFLSDMSRRYKMANPLLTAAPVKELGKPTPKHPVAIRDYDDLRVYLKAFDSAPYWHAWLTVACLAGLRFSEQLNLKTSDVDLKRMEIRVPGRKTEPRRVRIEQSILLPVLRSHLAARAKGQWGDYDWVFPSIVPDNPYKPRKLAPPGAWSHAKVWHSAFARAKRAFADVGAVAKYWSHGPDEWRHTFGTSLAMCGTTTSEIADQMGNSEAIAKKHYIAMRSSGPSTRWPLKFSKPNS